MSPGAFPTSFGRIGVALALFLGVAAAALEMAYRFGAPEPMLSGCPEVWAHRGDSTSVPENSPAGIRAAFAAGAAGVEMDVHFDVSADAYRLSHDAPSPPHDGEIPSLDQVLAERGARGRYWLDLKNLQPLSNPEVDRAVERLLELTEGSDLRDRILVESQAGWKLAKFAAAGFHTSYWLQPRRELARSDDSALWKGWKRLRAFVKWRAQLVFGRHAMISLGHRDYGAFEPMLPDRPVFTFTVDDAQRMEMLLADPRIQVVLTNNPALYAMTSIACTERAGTATTR